MKRTLLAALCLLLLFAFSACGPKTPETEEDFYAIADEDGFAIQDTILYAYLGDAEEITIPDTVTEIRPNALSWDMEHGVNLKKVTVPGTCTIIDEQAFAFTKADVIVLEEGVVTIGDMAFMDSYIDEIWFPESAIDLGYGILETEEGQVDIKIHVVKGSAAELYFTESPPYGSCEIISE